MQQVAGLLARTRRLTGRDAASRRARRQRREGRGLRDADQYRALARAGHRGRDRQWPHGGRGQAWTWETDRSTARGRPDEISVRWTLPAARPGREPLPRRRARHALEVGVEAQRRSSFAEPGAIDLDVGEHLLDVLARLLEGDAMDPVDRVDVGLARVAELLDPLARPAGAGVVAG